MSSHSVRARELTLGVRVGLNVPQRVLPCRVLVARDLLISLVQGRFSKADLLLFETPVGQFDLVREEVASRHDVSQPELGAQSSQAVLGLSIPLPSGLRRDLDDKVVVCISSESARELELDPRRLAHPSKPYPDTSFWKSTSETGGRTSCECNRLLVEMCSNRILVPVKM